MNELPPGWAMTTLGELGRYLNGRGFKRSEWASGGRPIVRIQNLTGSGESHNFFAGEIEDRYIVQPGDLLVSWAATLGAFLWQGPEAVLNQHIFKVDSYINKRFHYYLIQHLLGDLYRHTHGSGMVHITKGRFDRLPVVLPPLTEQRRIVAALEDHLSRTDVAESQLDATAKRIERCRDQILTTICAGWRDGNTTGRVAQPPSPAGVIDGDLPPVPADWQWIRLGEIADVVGGVTKDAKKQSDPSVPEYPYLRVANVQRGRLDLTNVTSIRVPEAKAAQLRLEEGDVLLNEGGDRDKLGRGWIWEGQLDHCIHQNHVFRARIHDGVLHPKLLAWHANGFGKRWCEANGTQSVNLASISLSKIKKLPVPVPPAAEQASLVEAAETYLSVLDRCELLIAQARAKSIRLRRSLLSESFAGRLVSQDPEDEPASGLLERIQRDRGAQPKPQRRRRAASASQEEALL